MLRYCLFSLLIHVAEPERLTDIQGYTPVVQALWLVLEGDNAMHYALGSVVWERSCLPSK